jgi:hypothetical protein
MPVDPTVPLPEIVAGPATNVPLPVYIGVPDEALVVFIKPEPPEWVGGRWRAIINRVRLLTRHSCRASGWQRLAIEKRMIGNQRAQD